MSAKLTRANMIKPAVFVACLIPLAMLIWRLLSDDLGPNPIEELTRQTGEWTLRLLLLTLTMTPLRHLVGRPWPLRFRRMLGLYVFFYACVHLLTYIWLDQFFWWEEIGRDIVKRPFITVGMTAFALLIPLAATSTQAMVRRLGRNWKRLHRLVYVVAVCGVVHFYWLVKADTREPLIYGLILLILLGARLVRTAMQRRRRSSPVAA